MSRNCKIEMTTKSKLTAARSNSQVLVDSLRRLSSNEALKGQARRRPEKTTKFGQKLKLVLASIPWRTRFPNS